MLNTARLSEDLSFKNNVILPSDEACDVWVDGSYFMDDNKKSGTGGVVTVANDPENVVLILAFNLTQMNISDSQVAELWAATLALERLKNANIARLTYDCSYTGSRIEEIKSGADIVREKTAQRILGNPNLFRLLKHILKSHEDMELRRVDRSLELIPLSDKFSRYAAKDSEFNMRNRANEVGAPCIYRTLTENGQVDTVKRFSPSQNM